ncbi:MAG: DinB family protein [Pyrinomonadaceae bacterium]
MSDEIDGLISNIREINREVAEVFGGLSHSQLNWKPDKNSWSIAQCLEHLIVTNDLYFKNIEKVADGTHRNNLYSAVPLVPDLIGFVMKKVLSPEWKWKVRTLKMFEPSYSEVSEKVLKDFEKNQTRFIELLDKTRATEYKKIKVSEPVGPAVNLRLIDAFEILVVHERRHFGQAKRILESREFENEQRSR